MAAGLTCSVCHGERTLDALSDPAMSGHGDGLVQVVLDPARAGRVPYLVTVGAYADLDTVLRFLATGRMVLHGRLRQVKPDPYGQFVFLRTYEEFLAGRATPGAVVLTFDDGEATIMTRALPLL